MTTPTQSLNAAIAAARKMHQASLETSQQIAKERADAERKATSEAALQVTPPTP